MRTLRHTTECCRVIQNEGGVGRNGKVRIVLKRSISVCYETMHEITTVGPYISDHVKSLLWDSVHHTAREIPTVGIGYTIGK